MPAGMSWHSMVTLVSPALSVKVVTIFISPLNLGSGDFELDSFHDFPVGDQLDKSAFEGVRVVGGLAAGRTRRVPVGERHSERAAFTRVEIVHMTLHVRRRAPQGHGVRIEAGLIYGFARRPDYL